MYNKKNLPGLSQVHYRFRQAISNSDCEATKMALEDGANPDHSDCFNSTMLQHAVQREAVEIVKLLIEYGADVKQANCSGETPLHQAAVKENIDLIDLLLAAGAIADQKDNDGKKARHYTRNKIIRKRLKQEELSKQNCIIN